MMRVVSLVPSATETLCLLGGSPMLVGVSHECDHPPHIRGLPVLTQARTAGGSPEAIDRQVADALASGDSLYRLDADLLRSLAPDLILTQDVCSVCSIDLASVRAAAAALHPPPRILSLNPQSLEEVLDDVIRVGEAVGLGDAAADAVASLRQRLWAAADHADPYADGPNVAFLEWTDPIFVGGHWTAQLIERAGGRHPLNPTEPLPGAGAGGGPHGANRAAGPSRRITLEDLAASQPDAIIVCPCGVGLDEAAALARDFLRQPALAEAPALRNSRLAVVDGSQMFNRPGPRLVDAFEWLVGWLNAATQLISENFPWQRLALSPAAASASRS